MSFFFSRFILHGIFLVLLISFACKTVSNLPTVRQHLLIFHTQKKNVHTKTNGCIAFVMLTDIHSTKLHEFQLWIDLWSLSPIELMLQMIWLQFINRTKCAPATTVRNRFQLVWTSKTVRCFWNAFRIQRNTFCHLIYVQFYNVSVFFVGNWSSRATISSARMFATTWKQQRGGWKTFVQHPNAEFVECIKHAIRTVNINVTVECVHNLLLQFIFFLFCVKIKSNFKANLNAIDNIWISLNSMTW